MYVNGFLNDFEPWMAWVGIAVAAVLMSGYAFFLLILLLRRSNDSGSNTSIRDFSSKGLENEFYQAGLAALDHGMDLPYFMRENEEEKKEVPTDSWRCKRCNRVNKNTLYVCTCGNTKKANES